jgi:ABC-type oligopeptide transport system substrate-binding subunit
MRRALLITTILLASAAALAACAPPTTSLTEFYRRQGQRPISDRPAPPSGLCASETDTRIRQESGRPMARGVGC